MRFGSGACWPIARELLLALVVLALAFVNFGHQSAVFAAGGRVVLTSVSVCGDAGALPGAGEHFACHACRPNVALPPPPPCTPLALRRVAETAAYAAPASQLPAAPPPLTANPRGPPTT